MMLSAVVFLSTLVLSAFAAPFDGSLSANYTLERRVASSGKVVVAHFMVGNTYSYSQQTWKDNINAAINAGIDGFALNVGSDTWEPARVQDAYAAAKGTNFKLFISLDMSSLPCASTGDATLIRSYINNYANDANQLWYNGKQVVSTFAGENCRFGQGSLNAAWVYAVKTGTSNVLFLPSFFLDPATFPGTSVMDGSFNWNGGWPQGNYDVNFDSDNNYINNNAGRTYMAAVSPLFFTHYSGKNFIYRSDNFLYHSRWEMLFNNKAKIDIAQIISWNDYGESHYIGPIGVDQPNSQAWTNGFNHDAFATLTKFYATAWKNSAWPATTHNKIYLFLRSHPRDAAASADSLGRPTRYDQSSDTLYAMIFSKIQGSATISIGSSTKTVSVDYGITKVTLPLAAGQARGTLKDTAGNVVLDLAPSGCTYITNPTTYNFNWRACAIPSDGISPIN